MRNPNLNNKTQKKADRQNISRSNNTEKRKLNLQDIDFSLDQEKYKEQHIQERIQNSTCKSRTLHEFRNWYFYI